MKQTAQFGNPLTALSTDGVMICNINTPQASSLKTSIAGTIHG
jgi:hypothetical protein